MTDTFALIRQFLERKVGKRVLIGLTVVGVLWLIDAFTQDFILGRLYPRFRQGVALLASQTVGFFGLVFLTVLLGCIIVLLLESSETAQALRKRLLTTKPARERSPGDEAEVERIREAWGTQEQRACANIAYLLEQAIKWLTDSGIPFSAVLDDHCRRHREAIRSFESGLVDNKVPFTEVLERLRAVVSSFRNCVAWFNLCDAYDVGKPSPLKAMSDYKYWLSDYTIFANSLRGLGRRSAFASQNIEIETEPDFIMLDGQRWHQFNLTSPSLNQTSNVVAES